VAAPACISLTRNAEADPELRRAASILRPLGIARADFQVDASFKDGQIYDLRITRRLYFTAADGPAATLIRVGTAVPALDQAALAEARRSALPDLVFDAPRQPYGVYIVFSLFSDPQLGWRFPSYFQTLPQGPWSPLLLAARAGDTIGAKRLLATRPGKAVLNRALYFALYDPADNRNMVALLLRAGADANANFFPSSYLLPRPLMLAAEISPCSIYPLLAAGARLEDRNIRGQTALDMAKNGGRAAAAAILEAAVHRRSGGK
jgi:hypothetical protein